MSSLSETPKGTAVRREFARKRPRSWKRTIPILLALAIAGVLVDGFFIEPYRVEVTHLEIQGGVATPLKIAFLSDLHSHGIGRRERKMFAALDREQPDIILISGDTVGNRRGDYSHAEEVYDRLRAPLGVWFVRGNWENIKPFHQERAFYRDAGVHFLLNSNAPARPDVWIAGLDDPYTGTPRLEAALAGIPAGVYSIALFHSPAYFDHLAGRVNLCLTGHTHGGQVRIPFVKPFWLPKGCGRFLAGWYEERGTKMYVSRGLGTSIVPIRFLCRPEITFLTIQPEQSGK
ncbi:MAG: metallophosphoesterase [Candidatus Acidiferrales bacterium]